MGVEYDARDGRGGTYGRGGVWYHGWLVCFVFATNLWRSCCNDNITTVQESFDNNRCGLRICYDGQTQMVTLNVDLEAIGM